MLPKAMRCDISLQGQLTPHGLFHRTLLISPENVSSIPGVSLLHIYRRISHQILASQNHLLLTEIAFSKSSCYMTTGGSLSTPDLISFQ